MKYFTTLSFLLVFGLSTFAQIEKKVLIIGIDGCRSDALQAANTPTIDELISNGIYSPDALNTEVTSSGPGWSAILTGVWSDKHGVTSNDFSTSNYEEYPPLVHYLSEEPTDFHTVSIVHWGPINDDIIQDNCDFTLTFSSDESVSTTASNYLSVNDPDLMFLHFDDVDHAGHSTGFTPSNLEYLEAIEGVDVLIAPIISAIENRPNYNNEDWLILVTTDHGGNGTSHGGSSFGERNIFFIASGNSIPNELILADSAVTTVENCLEADQTLFFDGENDYIEIPNNSIYNFGENQDFSIECRIRTQEAADVAIVGNKDWTTGYNPGFVFSFSGGTWKVNVGDGNNRVDSNGGEVSDNQWHTLSVTCDRDGEMNMYEDGVLVSTSDLSEIGDINTNSGLFFGTDIMMDFDYTGHLAEVRVWEGILSPSTISNWHCQSVTNDHPNYDQLLGYWPLTTMDDDNTMDLSVNQNQGQVNGSILQEVEEETTYDYTNTPRSVDVSTTALTHLCIPLLEVWDLDGISWVEDCSTSHIESELQEEALNYIYPTYVTSTLNYSYHWKDKNFPITLTIYSAIGEKVFEKEVSSNQGELFLNQLSEGVYLLQMTSGKHRLVRSFVKK